jgi:hypothetical protein
MYFLRRAISLVSLEVAYTITCAPKGVGPCVHFRSSGEVHSSIIHATPTCRHFRLFTGRDLHLYILRIQLEHSHTTDTLHLFTIPNGDRGPHMDYIRSGDIYTLHSNINFIHVYISNTGYAIENDRRALLDS